MSSMFPMALCPALSYDWFMRGKVKSAILSGASKDWPPSSLRQALASQAIESNPLDAEQIAMFEMFERENWPHEKRRARLAARMPHSQPETTD